MADLVHKTVTVTAAARSLTSLLGLQDSDALNVPLQTLTLQADGGNSNPLFVGGPGVTTSDWGIRIPTPAASVPAAPQEFSLMVRPVKLSEIYIVGTAGEKVHVCGFPW
jgi:hypothetical protein